MTSTSAAGPPRLVVLSGPSGVGKSTVVQWLRAKHPEVWVSVSATTRAPRPGEQDGVDYRFVTDERFDRLVADGELLEWAAFAGHRYGTPCAPVHEQLRAGVPALLEIELHGARQVAATVPDALLVFLQPPSWEMLRQRLVGRGTEPDAVVAARLDRARVELEAASEFDVVLVVHDVESAGAALVELMTAPTSQTRPAG